MKKLVALLMAATMVLSLCACGGTPAEAPTENVELEEVPDSENTTENIDMKAVYQEAVELEGRQKYAEAAIAFGKIADYEDARERSFANWEQVVRYDTISAGSNHTVAIKNDGTVIAVGKNDGGACDVSEWTDIISVSAGGSQTIGLKADHTVVATGNKDLTNVSGWTDIVAISAGSIATLGLKIDGTVLYCEMYEGALSEYDINEWTDVVEVSAAVAKTGTIAYRKLDGHVRVYAKDDKYGQCRTGKWSNMEAIAAGGYGMIGVDQHGNCEVVGFEGGANQSVKTIFDNSVKSGEWNDLLDIAAGQEHIVGLKADGTLCALHYGEIAYEIGGFPNNTHKGEADVFDWSGVVAIDAADKQTIALKADGTVLAAGDNSNGECDVSAWTDIRIPE